MTRRAGARRARSTRTLFAGAVLAVLAGCSEDSYTLTLQRSDGDFVSTVVPSKATVGDTIAYRAIQEMIASQGGPPAAWNSDDFPGDFRWSSSRTDLAEFTKPGLVVARAPGDAVLTVTTNHNTLSWTLTISPRPALIVPRP